MSVFYKQGVMGRLSRECRKCLGRIHDRCYQPRRIDMMVTSIQEGNHSAGSLHYMDPGDAFDFRAGGVPLGEIEKAAGKDFDVVPSTAGAIHVEYDPK